MIGFGFGFGLATAAPARRRRPKFTRYLVRGIDNGQLLLGVQIAVVEAAQRVQAKQARAGPAGHRGVVHIGGIVQRIDIRQSALGIGQPGLVQQRDVLQPRLIRNIARGLGATWLRVQIEDYSVGNPN